MKRRRHAVTGGLAALITGALLLGSCSGDPSGKRNTAHSEEGRGKVTVVVQDRGAVATSEGSYENNRWTRWIQENGPVDVTFVPVLRSESKKLLNVMFASGSAPDIINETNAPFRNRLYEQQQLLPLDDLLQHMPNYKKLLDDFPQLRKAGTKSDDKLYEIGRINEANPLHVFFIRKDWLEKLNLSMPRTTEELLQVALAFVERDPDENDIRDTYGINISYNSEGAVNEMFGIQQDHSWGWQDGSIVRQWDKELAALQYKKRLYDLGIVDSDYISDKDGSKAKGDFMNGKLGIYVNYSMNWFEFTMKDLVTLKNNDPSAVIVPLEYPVSPFGQYTGAIDNPIQMTTVFNKNMKDPVAAAQYVNFILEPETSEMLFKGHEGVHWTRGDHGCPVYTDINKWQTEVGYASTGAYGLFLSRGTDICNFVVNHFDPSDEVQRAGLELFTETRELYMDMDKQYPGITLGDYIPGLPADLDMIRTTMQKETSNLYVKAIVSGDKYSAEQAVQDAQAAWESAGGSRIVAYMNEWYASNRDTAFLAEDLWDIVRQQQLLGAEAR